NGAGGKTFRPGDRGTNELHPLVRRELPDQEAEDAKEVELELRHLPRPVRFGRSSWRCGGAGHFASVPCESRGIAGLVAGSGFFRFQPFHKPTASVAGKPLMLI